MGNIIVEAEPDPLEVDFQRTAVIVVDMQNAFAGKGGYFDCIGADISATRRIIPVCRSVIQAGREKGVKIVYLQMVYGQDLLAKGLQESPLFRKSKVRGLLEQRPELKDKLYLHDTWGVEIIEELRPGKDDIVIRKQKYDGFIDTPLAPTLQSLDIKYLIFLGTATNVCVESTIRRSFFLDYFPIVVSDGVSQKGPDSLQQATFQNVQLTFGWVTTSARLLNAMSRIEKK